MSDKKGSPRRNPSNSNPPSARTEKPHSPHQWDIEPDPSPRQERVRASSWDDSDENSTLIPESQSNWIYSSVNPKIRGSVSSEINQLKKQFFESLEKTHKPETSLALEELEQKLFSDRRLSPARIKRRTKSSGSLSPVLEVENQTSPRKTMREPDFLEVSSKTIDYDPSFYLNNFFTELRNRRISLIEPASGVKNLGEEMPKYDSDCVQMYNELPTVDTKDPAGYSCKSGRKLSQILEVEECRKDSEINSEGKTTPSRGKKTPRIPEIVDTWKNDEDKFKSFSSEYFINYTKPTKPHSGSHSERSSNIFDHKLDHEIITLSPKFGKTHLATPLKWQKEEPPSTSNQNEEKGSSLESLAIDLTTPENQTARKSATRSVKSGKSRRSCDPESPKFMLNIEGNSERSFKADDAGCFTNDNVKNVQMEGSLRCSNRSERSFEGKNEKNLRVGSTESINLTTRSQKHDHTKSESSSQRSHRKKQKQRNSITNSDPETPKLNFIGATNSPVESFRSDKRTPKQTSGRSAKEPPQTESGRTSTTSKTPKTAESRFLADKTTPRSTKIPELGLRLDTSERSESQKSSQRSHNIVDETASDRSNTNKPRSRRSERSLSSKSRHKEARTSTPRAPKGTPRGHTWRRSKDSLDNQDSEHSESTRMSPSRTLDKVCDALSSSVTSTSRSSLRELDIPNHQLSYRSELSLQDPEVYQKESESKKSSRRSIGSHNTDTIQSSPNPRKIKSRPNSWTSRKETEILENTESLSESWSLMAEEDENLEETNRIQTPKTGEETERQKRLSIINEVSFEDLETTNTSIEGLKDASMNNESKPDSPATLGSNKSISKTPKDSTGKPPSESGSVEIGKTEDGKWNALIETFRESSNSLENNFPGFQDQKEISWDSLRSLLLSDKTMEEWTPRKSMLQKNISSDTSAKIDEDLNQDLEDKVSSFDKIKKNEDSVPVQNTQNLFYFNLDQEKPFRIGEFGDVTSWNVADFSAKDDQKPKDHGDGVPLQNPFKIPPQVHERKEKESKAQRQLWTELREDFRDSKQLLNNLFHEVEDDFDDFTPTPLKTSKSDNWINTKGAEGTDFRNSAVSFLLNEDNEPESSIPMLDESNCLESTLKQNSSSENVLSENEDLEFDCDRTPRLSRSLSSLDTRLQEKEPSETSNSGSFLFKKTLETSKAEKESTNLGIFLARKEKKDKIYVKSNNWLKLKTSDAENPFKQGKKVKRKLKKKGVTSSRQGYLSSRSRTPIPSIKLRKSNCFRNFYKRFISVFCLTSNSSAATSN